MFAGYLGVPKAVSVQSGTAAIHIALHELGIGKGDEVIVPVSTFIATVNPIIYAGAKPVFADIDINTWNISVEQIAKQISRKTKAIMPVHLYGNPCAMDTIMALARKFNLYVIEDATESLGAKFKGKYTGTFGDFGCFSFNGNKTITTGSGGMVVGKKVKALEHIKFLVNQAKENRGGYFHPEIGFNYRMTCLQASLGIAQLEKLEGFLVQKKRFHDIYVRELSGIAGISFQQIGHGAESSYWMSAAMFDKKINIARLQERLKSQGIPTRRMFIPIVEFPPYHAYRSGEYKNAYDLYGRALCLPSSTLNSEVDIRYVCGLIRKEIFSS